jgi:signal transduction histidine kinase
MNKTAERALLARPLAMCLGAAAIAWLNPILRQDLMFLWLAAVFGAPNFLLWLARDFRPVARVAPAVSPVIGLLGWGSLATFTLGLKSPILAAFFFEVGLAAISMSPAGVAGVTSAAILVLALVQNLFGFGSGWQLWLLEAGFLAVMGGLGLAIAYRRVTAEAMLRAQGDELGQRLELLQRELDDERVVSRVGENVARLAHGLKNAVHSLRGFVGLIEPEVERVGGASREALAGLRAAIDDLERLARLTLADGAPTGPAHSPGAPAVAQTAAERSPASRSPAASVPSETRTGIGPAKKDRGGAMVSVALERAIKDLGPASPEVVFDVRVAPDAHAISVPIAETPLLELLMILLRNAVEAMHGVGRCTVELGRRNDRCHVEISDEGDGLPSDAENRLFTPGFTTKSGGSGFGLFLARRIVEDQGGRLSLVSKPEKGAIAVLELPVLDSPTGRAEGATRT